MLHSYLYVHWILNKYYYSQFYRHTPNTIYIHHIHVNICEKKTQLTKYSIFYFFPVFWIRLYIFLLQKKSKNKTKHTLNQKVVIKTKY